MLEDMYFSLIQAPDQPLSGFRLLRTVIDNPIKAWPQAVYREDVYRPRRFGRDPIFVMALALVRTALLDDADNFEKGDGPFHVDVLVIGTAKREVCTRGIAIRQWHVTEDHAARIIFDDH